MSEILPGPVRLALCQKLCRWMRPGCMAAFAARWPRTPRGSRWRFGPRSARSKSWSNILRLEYTAMALARARVRAGRAAPQPQPARWLGRWQSRRAAKPSPLEMDVAAGAITCATGTAGEGVAYITTTGAADAVLRLSAIATTLTKAINTNTNPRMTTSPIRTRFFCAGECVFAFVPRPTLTNALQM